MAAFFSHVLRSPVMLMCVSIILWMLYPPLVNYLIDRSSTLFVAGISHTLAAVATLVVVVAVFYRNTHIRLPQLLAQYKAPALYWPTLASGVLICTNHLLLYAALQSSQEFDVIAILIFEAWPILFFYIDSTLRKSQRTTSATDYIFSGAAFAGFVVLMAPNISLADWLLLESPMLNTIMLAALGGLAMAINCYMRMKCMDAWSNLCVQQNLSLTPLRRAILTETGVRCVAAPLILGTLFFFGQLDNQFTNLDYVIIAFVGVAILALGSLLYDLSVYSADNASISVFWYFMPVGAVIILATMQGRILNQYEAVASVLIVSANIFLGLKFPLRSSLLVLFTSVCLIGIWLIFAPTYPIDSYYDLLAVSTVFFVLLATFALERTTSLNRERERLLGEFNESVMRLPKAFSNSALPLQTYQQLIHGYITKHLFTFLRAFQSIEEMRRVQNEIQTIKHTLLTHVEGDASVRERLLSTFNVGEKIMTMESDRIPPEEFVILILLGATNVFFSLIFRPDSFSAALFSLIVATSVIFLILLINERDKYTQVRHDHGLVCRDMLIYANAFNSEQTAASNSHTVDAVEHTLSSKSSGPDSVVKSYWVFGVFTFLFFGFGYALLYETINDVRADESSPIVSNRNMNNAHVNIALLDWPAAQIKAHILSDIINTHTETQAHLIAIPHKQAFEEIGKSNGGIDVHPDIWVANNAPLIRKFVRAYKTMALSQTSTYGQQGLCYTNYQADGKVAMADLASAKTAANFDLSNNNRGDIWVGSKGWTALDIEKRRLNAYGLSKYYDYHVFDQDLLHKLINQNHRNQQASLFFCYYPDALFSNDHVKFISEPTHDESQWQAIMRGRNSSDELEGTSWPRTEIKVGYRASLASSLPTIAKLLDHYFIDNKDLVSMLQEIENGASVEAVSETWVNAHNDRIIQWLTGFALYQDKTANDQ
ncbi:hypothetical protein GTH32_09070 [Alteromonas sp. 345S023]|uniref:ABC-type glycine betaine transport system substrate-binding domain-containing protein n=1 Tax=Alteromonas profundi TaxID=2696062 RepID=A0A7X5LL28_9ALTE|nr:glycine betaine ABC transporter substrate-binding protein [Alteromonas profundi]NDV91328.1 hypothetical protein [Alteromonas profundi]